MSFFKSMAIIALGLGTQTVRAAEPVDNAFDDMSFAETVMALGLETYLSQKRGEVNPQMEVIVGYTDTGVPITQRRKGVAEMGKRMAKIMLEREEKLVREGKMKPRKRPLTWEQREAIIAERIAREGPITTETFIIPGTTPEQSEKIHNAQVGMLVKTNDQGKAVTHYVDAEGESIPTNVVSNKKNVKQEALPSMNAISVEKSQRHFVKDDASANTPNTKENDTQKSAEDLYRQFFPDEFKSNEKANKVSLLQRTFSWVISSAYAAESDKPSVFFTQHELKALKADKEKIEKGNKGKDAKELLEGAPTITPKIMDKAKALSDMIRSQPVDTKAAVKALDPVLAESLTEKEGKLVFKEEGNSSSSVNPNTITMIFISYSLSDRELLNIFKRNEGRADIQYVMRGVPEGQNIAKGAKKLQDIATQFTPQPNIIIDPTLFAYFNVKAVPTVVRAEVGKEQSELDRKNGHLKLLAKVEGLHNDEWLKKRIEQGEHGDLGQQGEIFEIAEPDMIEEMKRRVSKIDWEAKKQEAIKRFWKNQTFATLKQATKARTREINPSLIVTEDIVDANGLPIHKAGTVVNPLAMQDFHSMLVIFDPTAKAERDIIESLKAKWAQEPYKNRIYIASNMDKDRGWEAYEEWTQWLDEPLYTLMPDVKKRFEIEATPSLVTADNERDVFIVEELPVSVEQEEGESYAVQK